MKVNMTVEGRVDNPKGCLYSDAEARALLKKAASLGYPLTDPDFFEHACIRQLDEMITHGRYDC